MSPTSIFNLKNGVSGPVGNISTRGNKSWLHRDRAPGTWTLVLC